MGSLMRSIRELIAAVRAEAARADFPVDRAAYEKTGRDPGEPSLFAGSLEAPYCVLGRDLGKDEVAAEQPLIGAGGRLVRAGFYRIEHGNDPLKSDRKIESVLDHVLLTNTVPYKPPGNKAYATSVKERFRPFVAELLGVHWKGERLITLGTEAFQWFAPYADESEEFARFWKREDRYESQLDCTVVAGEGPKAVRKRLTLLPLPHPSPLNQRWFARFPALLAGRLSS
jgi:uracil-DNA glycosylase